MKYPTRASNTRVIIGELELKAKTYAKKARVAYNEGRKDQAVKWSRKYVKMLREVDLQRRTLRMIT